MQPSAVNRITSGIQRRPKSIFSSITHETGTEATETMLNTLNSLTSFLWMSLTAPKIAKLIAK